MSKALLPTLAAAIFFAAGAHAQEPRNDNPENPPAAKADEARDDAPKTDPLDELQKLLNKAVRAESNDAARTAIRELLDAPETLKGLSPASQIKFRKALENAEKSLDGAGNAAVKEASRAQIQAAQDEIDSARLQRAEAEKENQKAAKEIAWGVLGLIALIVLLPVLLMLLFAAPELLILLVLIGLVVFALVSGGVIGG